VIKHFLSIILVGLLFLTTLGYTLSRAQDPDFLARQARQVNLYGRLSSQLPDLLPKYLTENSPLSREEWAEVVRASVDGATFYAFLDGLLRAEIDWLTSVSNELNYAYSLSTVKEKAQTELTQKLLTRYQNQITCKPTELRDWQDAQGVPKCKLPPSNVKSSDVERLMSAAAAKSLAGVPSSVVITSTNGQHQARIIATKIIRAITFIWIVTAIFLALYWVILRSRAYFSLAFIFLTVGLLEIGFSLIAWDWLLKNVSDWLAGKLEGNLTPLVIDFLGAILKILQTILGNASILTLSFGAAMLLLAIYSKIRRPKSIF